MREPVQLPEAAALLGDSYEALKKRVQRQPEVYKPVKVPIKPGAKRMVPAIPWSVLEPMLSRDKLRDTCDVDSLEQRWLEHCAAKSLKPKSIDSNKRGIKTYWELCGNSKSLSGLNDEGFANVMRKIGGDRTRCFYAKKLKIYNGVTSFANWLVERDLMDLRDLSRIRKIKPKRLSEANRPSVKLDEFQEFIDFNRSHRLGRNQTDILRLEIILRLAGECALRRAEIASLKIVDLDFKRGRARIFGKGSKSRTTGLPTALAKRILQYLANHRSDSNTPELLVDKNGNPYKPDEITKQVARLTEAAGKSYGPHAFRRLFSTTWAKSQMPMASLQEVMGHSSIDITRQSYIEVDREHAAGLGASMGMITD